MKKLLKTCCDPALMPLRIVVGIIFVVHGSGKLFGAFGGPGIAGVTQFLAGLGFQGVAWAWLLACGEFFGGLFLLFGFLTRIAAIDIAIVMLVAITKVHWSNGLTGQGGYEYPLALFAAALTLLIAGGGKWSVDACLSEKCCQTGSSSGGTCCS